MNLIVKGLEHGVHSLLLGVNVGLELLQKTFVVVGCVDASDDPLHAVKTGTRQVRSTAARFMGVCVGGADEAGH